MPENEIVYCPNCHGRVLAADKPVKDLAAQRVPGRDYYCPSCEMFVEAGPVPLNAPTALSAIDPGAVPRNDGRPIASGTSAGGSQRGDLSDQGASLWRKDSTDGERNTWKDKD